MDWRKTSKSTIRSGDWCVVKWPWGAYCLWLKNKFMGRFDSAEEAKQHAAGSQQDHRDNAEAVA